MRTKLTMENFKDLIGYRSDGVLYRKETGKKLGSKHITGYLIAQIERKNYLVHRLVWFHYYGEMPKQNIDHINGIKTDNRIENLRYADYSQNGANRKVSKNNSIGLKGVGRNGNKYQAVIQKNGKSFYLGIFNTKEEASRKYINAAIELFGEFASNGLRRSEEATRRAEMKLV